MSEHTGDVMQAVETMAMAATMLATAEAVAAGRGAGVPPDRLLEVLNESSGGSAVSRDHFPAILSRRHDTGIPRAEMFEQVRRANDLADRLGLTLFMGRRTLELCRIAARGDGDEGDYSTLAELLFRPGAQAADVGQDDMELPAPGRRVGFIGLGAMGSRMTARLLEKGVTPTVFDVSGPAVAAAEANGAIAAGSAAEVAAASDLILLSLPDAPIVEAVVFGERGILAGVQGRSPAPVLLDTSSSKAETTRKIGESLRALGGDMLDVPVSRGQPAAEKGTLSIMIGGSAATLEQCRWLLELLGTDLIHVAGLGSGHAAKGLNNLVNAANVVIGGEALLLGTAAGLDARLVLDRLCAGPAASEVLAHRYATYVLPGTFNSNFRMALMCKDAAYGLEIAARSRVPALLCGTALQIYWGALASLGMDADNTELIKHLATWVGAEVPRAG